MTVLNSFLLLYLTVSSPFFLTLPGENNKSTLVLKNAEYNSNTLIDGKWVNFLKGNVTFEYNEGTIAADQATWYHSDNKILFQYNINATMEGKQLSCERIDFLRNDKKIIASTNIRFFDPIENVRITAQSAEYILDKKILTLTIDPEIHYYDSANSDTISLSSEKMVYNDSLHMATAHNNVAFFDPKEQIHIFSQYAEYLPEKKYLTLLNSPKMFQYDTAQSETLTILADTMIYNDSLNVAIAINKVTISRSLWRSKCKEATYDVTSGTAKLRVEPWIYYDHDELTGDSIDLFFSEKTLRGVSVMNNVKGLQRDITESDTIFREVTGDSIFMSIGDSNRLEKIWIYKNAKTLYYTAKQPEYINEAYGKVMILDFVEGRINTLHILGNAKFFYYLYDKSDSGKIESSGDSIKIKFKNGEATFMTITGAVRGTYFSKRSQ